MKAFKLYMGLAATLVVAFVVLLVMMEREPRRKVEAPATSASAPASPSPLAPVPTPASSPHADHDHDHDHAHAPPASALQPALALPDAGSAADGGVPRHILVERTQSVASKLWLSLRTSIAKQCVAPLLERKPTAKGGFSVHSTGAISKSSMKLDKLEFEALDKFDDKPFRDCVEREVGAASMKADDPAIDGQTTPLTFSFAVP